MCGNSLYFSCFSPSLDTDYAISFDLRPALSSLLSARLVLLSELPPEVLRANTKKGSLLDLNQLLSKQPEARSPCGPTGPTAAAVGEAFMAGSCGDSPPSAEAAELGSRVLITALPLLSAVKELEDQLKAVQLDA
jgi:hypothetical protein